MTATTKLAQRWLQFGVELEGGWEKPYRDVASGVRGAKGKGDGSLSGIRGDVGEIITAPYSSLGELLKDIKTLHPNYTNETAGFHIHASFEALDYSMLTSEEFWNFYRGRWRAWGEANAKGMTKAEEKWFWDRFDVRTQHSKTYCKAKFDPVEQLDPNLGRDNGKRYTQLNFSAWHKHRTVESRLLPMFSTVDITLSSVQEMSDIYNLFLNTFEMPSLKVTRTYTESEDGYMEEVVRLKTPDYSPLDETWRAKTRVMVPEEPGTLFYIDGVMDYMAPRQSVDGEHQ